MLSFIAYIFKIIISLLLGYLIGHDFKSEDKNELVLSTSFLSFLSSLFTSVVINLTQYKESFLSGFLIFGLFYILRNYISGVSMPTISNGKSSILRSWTNLFILTPCKLISPSIPRKKFSPMIDHPLP